VHRTSLLTWNPRIYARRDLRADFARLRRKGRLPTDWSCARSKQIRKALEARHEPREAVSGLFQALQRGGKGDP